MTDRELLEMAAKAAGTEIHFDEDGDCYRVKTSGNRRYWDPIISDGDALRLAVTLRMSVEVSEHEASTYAYAGKVPRVYAMELWRDDLDAATRRAIVRAAAEIGKAMS